jgi:hypothetical protein
MERPLIRGVAPQMRDQADYLTLGGGAGGRSLGSIFLVVISDLRAAKGNQYKISNDSARSRCLCAGDLSRLQANASCEPQDGRSCFTRGGQVRCGSGAVSVNDNTVRQTRDIDRAFSSRQ